MINLILYWFSVCSFLSGFCYASDQDVKPKMIGWVWGNGNRNTFDILWSCIAIVIICTWKVVHLNIPSEDESNASWRQFPFWRKWLRKAKWMGIMALSPEIILSMAVRDFLWSRACLREFERLSLRHPYAAQRLLSLPPNSSIPDAGSHVSLGGVKTAENLVTRTSSQMPAGRWTIVHAQYANMGGFSIRFPQADAFGQVASEGSPLGVQNEKPSRIRRGTSYPLSADDLLELVENFNLEVPYIHRRDIEDRSKSDLITKGFAIGQSLWLIVQSIARAAKGLPITELELATMGFVVCALILYLLWWHKPFDVEHSTTIDCPSEDRERILAKLRLMFEARYTNLEHMRERSKLGLSKYLSPNWEDFCKERRIRNWAYMEDLGVGRTKWLLGTLSIMLMGLSFSSLHISAWNWSFPSTTEQWLWRASSLTATTALVPIALLIPVIGNGRKIWQHLLIRCVIHPLTALYVTARLVLIVQCFVCFRSMPEGVYESVQWTFYLPSFN